MNNYFIRNRETGKLELHFDKAVYDALTSEQKNDIKHNFLWGRKSNCWISRAKEPNLYRAIRCAESIGLEDAGKQGERLSFAEQMERKAERAERRAERYDARSDAAEAKGDALQKPYRDAAQDWSFVTQPNINTSAGRAFTNRRNRMFAAFEKGFSEFRRSAYWAERAKTARATAAQKELKNKGFVMRRIAERESDIRKLKKNIEAYEGYAAAFERGEEPVDSWGYKVKRENVEANLERWLDMLEAKLDELGFYQDCLEDLGGVQYDKSSFKRGDLLYISRWKEPVRFVRGGPKNFTYEFTLDHMRLADGRLMWGQASYAEITGRVEEKPAEDPAGNAAEKPAEMTPGEFLATVAE